MTVDAALQMKRQKLQRILAIGRETCGHTDVSVRIARLVDESENHAAAVKRAGAWLVYAAVGRILGRESLLLHCNAKVTDHFVYRQQVIVYKVDIVGRLDKGIDCRKVKQVKVSKCP